VRDISPSDLYSVLGASVLNLIRRGADGSLRLSADRWRLADVGGQVVVFRSVADDQPEPEQLLEVHLAEVQRMTWDRLPKQQTRSQVRFHLVSGDLWTFSGTLADPSP
jgi:hypothetical protein